MSLQVNLKSTLRNFLRTIFHQIPISYEAKLSLLHRSYKYLGFLYAGLPHYERWVEQKNWLGHKELRGNPILVTEVNHALRSIAFPYYDSPEVTIIIPTYGKLAVTLTCLRSIFQNQPKTSFEIIVIEDASGDKEIDKLAAIPGVVFHKNSENVGFIKTCNKASNFARGIYLHYLNNDTEVTSGWLDSLIEIAKTKKDAGIVGSKLVFSNGKLQEAGGIIWKDGTAANYGRLNNIHAPSFNYLKEVDYISGASILILKSLFERVGKFDELFAPAYYEDGDLGIKIRMMGFKVYYTPKSTVIHYEGISNGRDTSKSIKSYQIINQKKFHKKWSEVLKAQHANPTQLFWARDRSMGKKTILVLDQHVPEPDKDAGSRAIHQLLKLFLEMGFNVKFWPQNLKYSPQYTDELQSLGIEVIYGNTYKGRFHYWLKNNIKSLDYALISRPNVADDYLTTIKRYTTAKILFYGHDIHHLRIKEEMRTSGESAKLMKDFRFYQALETKIWSSSDRIYYPSNTETELVQNHINSTKSVGKAFTVPLNGYSTFYDNDIDIKTRNGILFVGGFNHKPNEQGILWFCANVLPLIILEQPDCKLTIVGSYPSDKIKQLHSKNIVVKGNITDDELHSEYSRARVSVAPLLFGAGIKGKVIESMRMGVPMVTTPIGAQGFDIPQAGISVSESPEEIAFNVLKLICSDDIWHSTSEKQLTYAKQYFSKESLKKIFLDL